MASTKAPSRSTKARQQSLWVRLYQSLYNAFIACSWIYYMCKLGNVVASSKNIRNPVEAIYTLAWDLTCVQAAEILETLHALLGLTSAPVFLSIGLYAGRLVPAAFGAMTLASAGKLDSKILAWSFVVMSANWAIADSIRFLMYIEAIWVKSSTRPSLLKRMKYTASVVLFPFTVVLEAILIEAARKIRFGQAPQSPYNIAVLAYLFAALPLGSLFTYKNMLSQYNRQLKSHTN